MPRCFVIGPIGDSHAPIGSPGREKYEQALDVYEKIIVGACNQVGLVPVRADQIAVTGEITEQVFRHLYEDEVVIADVSDGNPNVMYELGLRHTRDLLTIQIGEYEQLPFDISAIRTIEFSRSERGLIDARKKLLKALTVGLAEGSDPVTATKIWLSASKSTMSGVVDFGSEVTGLDTEVDEIDPDGLFDLIQKVEETFPRLTNSAARISNHMEEMGTEAEVAGRNFEQLAEQGAPTAARLSALARFAEQLTTHADDLDQIVAEFATDMDLIDGSVNGILEFLSEHPDSWPDDADDFLGEIESLAVTSRETMESIGFFAGTVRGLGQYSKALRRPSERIFKAVTGMGNKIRLMDEWEGAVARLRHHRIDKESPESVVAGDSETTS